MPQQESNSSLRLSGGLIGSSPEMQKVYDLLSMVSSSTSTVLIQGETGTGKELAARALHNSSPLKDKPMIKVNCAALPSGLIESELFGHEKGSFSGALQRRIGKFELANDSSLFLDEIGELPIDLQPKLLRAIQEREIERVGASKPIRIKVRIIVATNRDLLNEVSAGRFRSDLFYRLNVFPIYLPPLREHSDDLPELVTHFINKFAKALGKTVTGVSPQVMDRLKTYHWPGNIRELEHVIERHMILAQGPLITSIDIPDRSAQVLTNDKIIMPTIYEMEKMHILNVLRICNWKIQGNGGAAQMLDIPPTTLHSRIKRLGITKSAEYRK